MRAVRRGAGPPILTDARCKGPKELVRARKHMNSAQNARKPFAFAVYKSEDVKRSLEDLFHGKCAYCEGFVASTAPFDVEHYRPKGEVEGAPGHPGYWWLAMAWDNLLPSCIDCNRRRWQDLPAAPPGWQADPKLLADWGARVQLGKQASFPIAGTRAEREDADLDAEQALLLDPTRDDPAAHLRFHIDPLMPLGLVLPKLVDGAPSPRGLASIRTYGLNRLGLVQERTRILRKLSFLAHMIDELTEIIADLAPPGAAVPDKDKRIAGRLALLIQLVLDEIRGMAREDQPHSSLVVAWAAALEVPNTQGET